MAIYMVTIKGENKGQFFSTKEEAERRAGHLNDIPDGVTYTVAEIELK